MCNERGCCVVEGGCCVMERSCCEMARDYGERCFLLDGVVMIRR